MTIASKTFLTLLAFIAICCLVFYWPWLSGQAVFYAFDLTTFWEPLLTFIGQSIRAGHLPLWNPYLLCGIPQIANMHPGIFYPPNLLFAAFNFSQALAIIIILSHLVAAAGMFLLIEDLGLGLTAATFAALTMSFGGVIFSLSTTYLLQASCAWLPMCIFVFRKLGMGNINQRLFFTTAAALAYFMLVCAGVPEVFLPFSVFLVVFSLIDWWNHRQLSGSGITLILRGLAVVLGLLLAMPSLLPAAEWASLSRRAAGLESLELFQWSTTWYDLVGIIAVSPWGDTFDIANQLRSILPVYGSDALYIASCFLSPLVFTYAIWGLSDRSWAYRIPLLVTGGCMLLLSLGNGLSFVPWFYYGLHITMFRYPVKILIFALLALIIAAARGMWLQLNYKIENPNLIIACIAWITLLVVGSLLYFGPLAELFFRIAIHNPATAEIKHLAAQLLGKALVYSSVIGLLTCILSKLHGARRLHRDIFVSCTLLLLTVLLITPAAQFQRHAGQPDFYSTKPYLESILQDLIPHKSNGPFLRICSMQPTSQVPAYLLEGTDKTATTQWYSREILFPMCNIDCRIGSTIASVTGEVKTLTDILIPALKEYANKANDRLLGSYWQLTSTQYVIDWAQTLNRRNRYAGKMPMLCPSVLSLVKEDLQMNVRVYAVKNPLPRAYFAPAVAWGSPHGAVEQMIARSDISKFDPHKLTVLEHSPGDSPGPKVSLDPNSSISFVMDQPEHVQLIARTEIPNYLILTDQYFPGWTANVDGVITKIFPANGLCRAVYIPAGHHLVDFTYYPTMLNTALICGGASLLGCIVLLWLAFFMRDSSRSLAD